MSHVGGLKAAAKRTAFGDVSNTLNISRPSKDDSAIGGKVGYQLTEKPNESQLEKKTTSLLRPAQRPLSVSGLKSLLNNVTSSNNQPPIKQPLADIQESVQPKGQIANLRKAFTKRNTSVFKDSSQIQSEQQVSDVSKPSTTAVAVDLSNHTLEHPPEATNHNEQKGPQFKVRRAKSNYFEESGLRKETIEVSNLPDSSEEAPALRSDGVYIDNNGEIQIYQYPVESDPEQDQAPVIVHEDGPVLLAEIKTEVGVAILDKGLQEQLEAPRPELLEQSKITALSEPEEYWDEEEEYENYDEDGYVTARSYKSRGENTTSGATTILFPKMNQKVRRELAAAKDLMEGAKITEDLDDESWDTTMVAEYGDEIFEYMKELEVSRLPMETICR